MYRSLRLITFDVTNTLISVSRDIGSEYAKVASIYGIRGADDPERISRLTSAFKNQFRAYNQELPNFGHSAGLTSVQWWSRLVVATFTEAGFTQESERKKIQNTAAHLYKLYSRGSQWKLKDGAHDLLFQLRQSRPEVTLAVLSNFDERLESILRDLGLVHFFKYLFVSRELGVAKPDPELWKYVFGKAGITDPAKEYLHVGDSVQLDYRPVRELNGNALVISKKNSDADPDGKVDDPAHVVSSLKDLQGILIP